MILLHLIRQFRQLISSRTASRRYPDPCTGDHETGGLTIGYAGTNYDTYLKNLENQTLSYAKFDSEYVASYKVQFTRDYTG